jgi:hypothetical protein
MKRVLLCAATALILSFPATAGGRTLADSCIAHVSNGAVTTFRDVDVLGSGRARIAYFRCLRAGLRDRSDASAFAGLVPNVSPTFGGTGLSGSGVTL